MHKYIYYPTIVKMFYANLIYANGVISSEVKKHQISMSLEKFVEICNLPYFGPHYLDIDQSEDFIIVASFSFLQDLESNIPSYFLMGNVHPHILLISYVANHILIPIKHNIWQLSKDDMVMTWSLANKVETNWAIAVIHHMMVSKIKGLAWVPNGHLV